MLNYKNKCLLAKEFGLSIKTLKKRLAKYDIILPNGQGVNPRYQKLIYECMWYPDGVNEKDYSKVKMPQGYEDE